MNKRVYLLFICLSVLLVQNIFAQKNLLTNFPNGFTPEEVGSRLAYRFVNSKHALYVGKWIGYYETFTHSAAFEYAVMTKKDRLAKLVQDKFDCLLTKEKRYLPPKNHVDLNTFGSLPLKLYKVTKKKCYFDLGMSYADSQWEVPADAKPKQKEWADKGYTWQTRLWIDDMYMIPILQIEAYKATKDSKYIDRAAKEMVLYLNELRGLMVCSITLLMCLSIGDAETVGLLQVWPSCYNICRRSIRTVRASCRDI